MVWISLGHRNCTTQILDSQHMPPYPYHLYMAFSIFSGSWFSSIISVSHLQRMESLLLLATSASKKTSPWWDDNDATVLRDPVQCKNQLTCPHTNSFFGCCFQSQGSKSLKIIVICALKSYHKSSETQRTWKQPIDLSNRNRKLSSNLPPSIFGASQVRRVHQWGRWLAAVKRKMEPKKKVAASVLDDSLLMVQKSGVHHLRLVSLFPIIYRVSNISKQWLCWDFWTINSSTHWFQHLGEVW